MADSRRAALLDRPSRCLLIFTVFTLAGVLSSLPGPAHAQSAAVSKFNTDSSGLTTTLSTMLNAAQDFDKKLFYVQGKLDLPGKISSDLKTLNNAMGTAKTLLEAASIVPEIKTEADVIIEGITTVRGVLGDAQSAADSFDTAITPVKTTVNTAETTVHALADTIQKAQQTVSAYASRVSVVQMCINGLPAQSRATAQSRLDTLVGGSDSAITALNTALQALAKRAGDASSFIEAKVYPLFGAVNDVENAIGTVNTSLQNIEDPLRDVAKVVNSTFGVSFPYPHPSWSHPFRWDHYNLRFSLGTIIGGVEKIENEIERILSKALYSAAKFFGIEKLIHSLVDDVNKALNTVMSKLHLQFKVEVPGLDRLRSSLDSIRNSLPGMTPQMSLDPGTIGTPIAALEKDLASINVLPPCGAPTQSLAPVAPASPGLPSGRLAPLGPHMPGVPPPFIGSWDSVPGTYPGFRR